MSHNLSLAQSHAFQLSRDLMVPVTVFQVEGEYGVLPSDEIDADDDLEVVHDGGRVCGPAAAAKEGEGWYELLMADRAGVPEAVERGCSRGDDCGYSCSTKSPG